MSRHQRALGLFTAILVLSLTGAGCQDHLPHSLFFGKEEGGLISDTQSPFFPKEGAGDDSVPSSAQTWRPNTSGFETLAFTDEDGDEIGIMYAFDPDEFRFRFENSSSIHSIVEWMTYSTSAVAVMNGVYFHDDGSPSGLLVHNGTEISTRRFSDDKSSVIRLSPAPAIVDTNEIAAAIASQEAAQSYPLLLEASKPQVTTDTGNKAQRSFIGFRDDGHLVLGVIMKKELSLYELSQLLSKKDYRLTSALNVDGGSSSGLYSRDEDTMSYNSLFPVPNVITVYKK